MTRQKKPHEYAKDADPWIVFGIDTEWVFESAGKNRILSYQFCLLNADSGKQAKLIIYPKNGKRISLENGLTRAILKARREKVIDNVPRKFTIAGHFTRADLTTFSDFGYFKRRTGAVRKTYATTEIPLSLRLASNEGPVRCSAVIIDTMLLAPAGTSLEKLGNLLGVPKIDLPEGYSKDRMDIFLRDHPALFEEYALTDAVIPALWVVKTYGLLLDRLGIKKKVVTLGGAAVELVKEQAKAKGIELHEFLGREKKKKRPLAHLVPQIAIAAQSYHGGYNIATALGFSPEGRELHDLDIRSAYTTALAFIGIPDWHSARHCTELDQLAVIDEAMTAALVEFQVSRRNAVSMPAGPGLEQQRAGLPAGGSVLVHRARTGGRHREWRENSRAGRIPYRLDRGRGPAVRGHHAAGRRDQGRGQGARSARHGPRQAREGNRQFHLWQGRAGCRQHADHQGRRRATPRVQHEVRRDRPDGSERDHQCNDGGVLHGPGSRIADRDADAAAGRDVGRNGNHGRHADRRRVEGYRPERTRRDGIQGGAAGA